MNNLKIFGTHEPKTIKQMQRVLELGGGIGVLQADGHLGNAFPIGGVWAHPNLICIQGAGSDLFCGNKAVKTNLKLNDIKSNIEKIMDDIADQLSFGVGKKNNYPNSHEIFDDQENWKLPILLQLKDLAASQLGTIGSSNHYVDIFSDESENIWVGVHFGSRGFGYKIAQHFMHLSGAKDGYENDPTFIKADSEIGIDYIYTLGVAGKYAFAGRDWVCDYITKNILGGNIVEEIHNHHNAVWRENHFGEDYWVVRKGATPAFPNQKGFVGGSMGDCSVILEGIDSEISKQALYSTVHGAGRVMSRTAAKGKFTKNEEGKKIRQEGLVRHDDMMAWLKKVDVVLRGGDLDEAPQAYRRLPDVLSDHEGTIKILHTLKPLGVAMAGKDIKDPYKD